jgi:hypothetical protein
MLDIVYPTRFIRAMSNGRTKPFLLECEDSTGNIIELVVKCSAGCFEKEKNLALEAIAAMLAADLNLPVPEPFLVKIEPEFTNIIDNAEIKQHVTNSSIYAFGSRFTSGLSVWPNGQLIPDHMALKAAEIFVFDAIIINSDRRPENPNCLFSGSQVAIIDHELTFMKVLFWKEPWMADGFDDLSFRDKHIFAKQYYINPVENLDRFINAWETLPETRFRSYKNALPIEWLEDESFVDGIIEYLQTAKYNIRKIADNALRAFK